MNQSKQNTSVHTSLEKGKELCRTEDAYGKIVVSQRGGRRVLQFDSALEQSSVYVNKLHYPVYEYTQAMLLGLLFSDTRHFTVLGLGGGGLVHSLNHNYPEAEIQIVELRQTVIDIAYDWFDLPRESTVNVIQADARLYVQQKEAAVTDIIFSDLYASEGMSLIQGRDEFIGDCHKALKKDGCLVLNFHELPDENSAVMKSIQQNFSHLYVCHVLDGNHIIFCLKQAQKLDHKILNQRAEALADRLKMPLMHFFRMLNYVWQKS